MQKQLQLFCIVASFGYFTRTVVSSTVSIEVNYFVTDYLNIFKFMNRILGMEVERQNAVFGFFTDTLNAIIAEAKKIGEYDRGIMGKFWLVHPYRTLHDVMSEYLRNKRCFEIALLQSHSELMPLCVFQQESLQTLEPVETQLSV